MRGGRAGPHGVHLREGRRLPGGVLEGQRGDPRRYRAVLSSAEVHLPPRLSWVRWVVLVSLSDGIGPWLDDGRGRVLEYGETWTFSGGLRDA